MKDLNKLKKVELIEKIEELRNYLDDYKNNSVHYDDLNNEYISLDEVNLEDLYIINRLRELKETMEFSIFDKEEFDRLIEEL